MGRIPKSKDAKTNRLQPKSLSQIATLEGFRHVPPEPPGLCRELSSEWRSLWLSDIAQIWTEQDYPVVSQLFILKQMLVDFKEEIGDSYITIGSTGQVVVHPLVRQSDVARTQIIKLLNELLLTPMARKKAGLELGDVESGGGLDMLKVDFK